MHLVSKTSNAVVNLSSSGPTLVHMPRRYSHVDDKLNSLKESMVKFNRVHQNVSDRFDSIQTKFRTSTDNFNANLYLYPSYAHKCRNTLEKLTHSINYTLATTEDVLTSVNDPNIANHATQETLARIQCDIQKLNGLNDTIQLFDEIALVLDESTERIEQISKKYQVYSELNYHLHPEKIKMIDSMSALFPEIEDLKHLKGPVPGKDGTEVIGVCYDGLNEPSISPIWFKFDRAELIWHWTPFDPFSKEWDMFSHAWIHVSNTCIDGEFGGEVFDGSEPGPKNVQIIEYLHDHIPVPCS